MMIAKLFYTLIKLTNKIQSNLVVSSQNSIRGHPTITQLRSTLDYDVYVIT